MAVGPALRQLDAHRSIHNASFAEAKELTRVIEMLFMENKVEECLETTKHLIDYIKSKIISHADAEEEDRGLYVEILKQSPELEKDIHMLTRDHDIIRKIMIEIDEDFTKNNEVTKEMINKFNAILIVNEIHSRSEEERLLSK